MKKHIILLTIFLTFISCSINEKPQFIGVENIKILKSTSKHITFSAHALFTNPNDVGGELQTDKIKVFINDNEMATISAEHFKVPAKEKFSIPLKANVRIDSLFSNNSIQSFIGSLFMQKVKIQYKGIITYKVLGFSHLYNIDETEHIKIKI